MEKIILLAFLVIGIYACAQNEYVITVESKKPSGIIDEMLYGQLFEHIYFSANNGVWQELIQERSFEPERRIPSLSIMRQARLLQPTAWRTKMPLLS